MTREEEIRLTADKYCLDEYTRLGFVAGAEWADSHPRWISVEEEFPPHNQAYLAYWLHLGVGRYRFVKANEKVAKRFKEHITHWMPFQFPKVSSSSEFPNNCEEGGEE